jgi:hypothetical protein
MRNHRKKREVSDNRFVVFLNDVQSAYVEAEAEATGNGYSNIIRDAVASRIAQKRRAATTLDELFPVEAGAY